MGALYRDLVRKHSVARGSARAVLNILADYATDEGLAWPGRAQLASDTGMSERTVIRCIQTLCEQGRLSIEENAKGGRGRVPVYKIHVPEVKKGDSVTPYRDAKRVTNGQIKGDNLTIKGDKYDNAYIDNNRSEPTTKREKEIAADAAPPVPPDDAPPKGKPTRSRKSKAPPKAAAPPRKPSEWQDFVGAFCWVCHGHMNVKSLTKEQRGALLSEGKSIYGERYTTDDLKEWYKRIWGHSWQYKKDKTSRPKPSEVRSSIAQLRAETPEGFEVPDTPTAHVNGTSKVAGSLAALADYEEIKARHGATG